MKRNSYMASNEMNEFMWLSATRQIFEKILATTKDKVWRRKIKTCDTLIKQVIEDRTECFDELELKKAYRRILGIGIKVYSYDDARVDKDDFDRKVTIAQEDFFNLVDAAFLQCRTCPQGSLVKECPRRKMFHRLGLQVYESRQQPKDGECEFRYDNEQTAVTPQYRCLDKDIEQLP